MTVSNRLRINLLVFSATLPFAALHCEGLPNFGTQGRPYYMDCSDLFTGGVLSAPVALPSLIGENIGEDFIIEFEGDDFEFTGGIVTAPAVSPRLIGEGDGEDYDFTIHIRCFEVGKPVDPNFWTPVGGNWFLHESHGYQYIAGEAPESLWLFDNQLGVWFWTAFGLHPIYPYLCTADGRWFFYSEGSQNPRWFFDYTMNTWIGSIGH